MRAVRWLLRGDLYDACHISPYQYRPFGSYLQDALFTVLKIVLASTERRFARKTNKRNTLSVIHSIPHQVQKPAKTESLSNEWITLSAPGGPLCLMRRCSICRCPILQQGAFDLCLGCAVDHALEIMESLNRKKASVTLFKTRFMLSEVNPPSQGGNRLEPNPTKRSANLEDRSVTKSRQYPNYGSFMSFLGLLAFMEVVHAY